MGYEKKQISEISAVDHFEVLMMVEKTQKKMRIMKMQMARKRTRTIIGVEGGF